MKTEYKLQKPIWHISEMDKLCASMDMFDYKNYDMSNFSEERYTWHATCDGLIIVPMDHNGSMFSHIAAHFSGTEYLVKEVSFSLSCRLGDEWNDKYQESMETFLQESMHIYYAIFRKDMPDEISESIMKKEDYIIDNGIMGLCKTEIKFDSEGGFILNFVIERHD